MNTPKQENIVNTVLRVRNPEGLKDLQQNIDIAIHNIYENRAVMVADFRKELFANKVSNEYFSNWNMSEDGTVTVKQKSPKKPPSSGPFNAVTQDYSYDIKEYNNLIRYAYRKVIGNLQNAKRSVDMAIKYDGEVDIPGDVLNNIEFFGNEPESRKKVKDFGERAVSKFFKNRTNRNKTQAW